MTANQAPYAPGCPVNGEHVPLPHLHVAFPWIEQAPSMAKAVTALTVNCTACTDRHRELAGANPELPGQAMWLWLGTVAITRVSMGLPPVSTAADMMDGLFGALATGMPSFGQGALSPTFTVFRRIPLNEVATPEGDTANTWQQADADRAINALPVEHREMLWTDLITLLSGWYRGTARAHEEAQH